MKTLALTVLVMISLFAGCNPQVETTMEAPDEGANHSPEASEIYTVAKYDPSADPASDLEATVAQAQRDGKHIILEIGGEW